MALLGIEPAKNFSPKGVTSRAIGMGTPNPCLGRMPGALAKQLGTEPSHSTSDTTPITKQIGSSEALVL